MVKDTGGVAPNTANVRDFPDALFVLELPLEVKPPLVVRPPDFPTATYPPVPEGNEGAVPVVVMELNMAGVDVDEAAAPDLLMCVVDNEGVGPGNEKGVEVETPPDFITWPPEEEGGSEGAKFAIPAGAAGVGTGPAPYPGNPNPPPPPGTLVPWDIVIPAVPPPLAKLAEPVSPGARVRRVCRENPVGRGHL